MDSLEANILVVDDESYVRTLMQAVLQNAGYRVMTAADAAEALQFFRSQAQIDLLITDIIMPGLQGPELVDQLIALRPNLRVLFISGFTADPRTLRGFECLKKPFLPDQLVATVQQLLVPAGDTP